MLSHEEVQEILQLLDTTGYRQLTLETDRFKLSLQRSGADWTAAQEVISQPLVLHTDAPAPPATAAAAAPASPAPDERLHAVRAPLPGVFYRAPKPGAEPYVDIGSRVEANTQVCIMESMKLMNAVYAGVNGTVADIRLNNGDAADKDAVLMLIEPASGAADA